MLAGVHFEAQAAGGLPLSSDLRSRSENAQFSHKTPAPEAGVLRQKPVRVYLQNLDPAAGSGPKQAEVEIFDGQTVTLDLDRSETRSAGNFTWYGKIQGYPRGHAILTVVDGTIAATIDLGEIAKGRAAKYQIQTLADGLTVLRQVDPNTFPVDHPAGAEVMLPPAAPKALSLDASADPANASGTSIGATAADSGSTIDVMVLYSNQSAAAAGTAIGAQIQQAVDTANLVYANSGITTRLRLVHAEQLNYTESGNIDTDLQRLPSNTTVSALRNTYGADLVIMFTEGGGYCGSSYLGPSSSYAFAVVNRGCASSNYSFPHEIGHLFGARHDAFVDASTTPYAYGHGFVNCTQGFRDVMAYPTQCGGTRIAYLSTPLLTYGSPASPLGTAATADNVRVHNSNAVTRGEFPAGLDGRLQLRDVTRQCQHRLRRRQRIVQRDRWCRVRLEHRCRRLLADDRRRFGHHGQRDAELLGRRQRGSGAHRHDHRRWPRIHGQSGDGMHVQPEFVERELRGSRRHRHDGTQHRIRLHMDHGEQRFVAHGLVSQPAAPAAQR